MPKRISVCCDGTGNDTRTNSQVWSNVGHIADCIVDNAKDKQVVRYLCGIGVSPWRTFGSVIMATGDDEFNLLGLLRVFISLI